MLKNESWIYSTKGFIILLLTLANIFMWSAYFMIKNVYEGNEEKAGQLGDTFGVITSFFSTLTFAGLIYSIFVQRKEMVEQNQINAAQLKTNILIQDSTAIQRFETTFFRMVERLEKARERVEINDDLEYKFTGDAAFKIILKNVNDFFYVDKKPVSYTSQNHAEIARLYKKGNQSFTKINHYYKEFENILILIVDSNLPLIVRRFYVRVLQTYLTSEEELVLLYYYVAFQINPPDKAKDEIVRILLFKTMSFGKFPDSPELTYNDWLFDNSRLDRLKTELTEVTKM